MGCAASQQHPDASQHLYEGDEVEVEYRGRDSAEYRGRDSASDSVSSSPRSPRGEPPVAALILGASLAAEQDGGRGERRPSSKQMGAPSWERLDDKTMVLENRKLRGDLSHLEKQMKELRDMVDAQLQFKDQQITDAHKKIVSHRLSGAVAAPHGAGPTAVQAAKRVVEAEAGGAIGQRMEAAANTEWVQQQQELNDDLRSAAATGELKLVQHALLRGADIDAVDDEGNTALLQAVRKNRVEAVVELLRHGAAMDGANRYNMTAMNVAVRGGFVDVLRHLRHRGCPLQMANGYSAMFEAARLGQAGVVDCLLQDPSVLVDEVNLIQETPLLVAARAGHEEVARTLILHGAVRFKAHFAPLLHSLLRLFF